MHLIQILSAKIVKYILMTVRQLVEKLKLVDQDAEIRVKNNYEVDPDDSQILDVDATKDIVYLAIDNSTMLFDVNVFGMYNWKAQLLEEHRDKLANVLKKSSSMSKEQLHDNVVSAMTIYKPDIMKYLPEFC